MDKLYTLNGIHYSKTDLLNYANSKLADSNISEWEHDLYSFIIEWFSKSSFITISTSGSTGKPKPIELSKPDLYLSALRTISYFSLAKGNSLLLCLSVKYIAGMMMVVRAFVGEMNLVCVSPQSIENNDFNNSPIDFVALVPLQLEQLLKTGNQIINFKKIIIGGAALSKSLSEKLLSSYTGMAYETYGMTETITHVAVCKVENNNKKIFRAIPHITFSVDERECLIIYDLIYNRTFVTNDRVELLSTTEFVLLGRVDNVINSGGIKIQPEEIETILAPFISGKYVVSSIADTSLGNKLVLIVEKGQNTELIKNNIFALLPTYKQPKSIIELNNIPLTSSGKIDFIQLKKILE